MKFICCVHDLLEIIHTINTSKQFNETQLWYRGQSNSQWDILPGVYRDSRIYENQMANHFKLKAPGRYPDCPNTNEHSKWLPLMQHYGLPTRLLDWSESPLIALYFAINSPHQQDQTDRSLWILSPGLLNSSQNKPYIPFLESEEIKDLLIDAFRLPGQKSCKEILAVTAPQHNLRMVVQHSQFTIHGSEVPMNKMSNSENFLEKCIIPSKSIQHIKLELKLLGIKQSCIFPDLQNLAAEIAAQI